MEIIRARKLIERLEYYRVFENKDRPGSGFSFPCDARGKMLPHKNEDAEKNYQKCLENDNLQDKGIVTYCHSYIEPAMGLCVCGRKLELAGFTNHCNKCGRDYNFAGSLLAQRSEWGAETGESWWECL